MRPVTLKVLEEPSCCQVVPHFCIDLLQNSLHVCLSPSDSLLGILFFSSFAINSISVNIYEYAGQIPAALKLDISVPIVATFR